ncbi:MAG: preprotein translocase subunit SecG [Pseudomonadota bacterium]
MQNIVLVILLIIALALILIVLMQRSEGGGLGIGGGGGGNMSGRPPASPLAKVTWALGAGFMAASLALTVIANQDAATTSVIDRVGTDRPQADADDSPSTPLGADLLPPTPEADPTQPPSAEN